MKNKIPLIMAALLGVVALIVIRNYVKGVENESQARLKGAPVVTARRDIPAGAEVSLELVCPKDVPTQFIPAQAVQGSTEVKQIIGRKTAVPIRAGQIVLWSDLEAERRGGFSALIPEGEHAFAVEIVRGIQEELIQPNDHIDIVASFALPKSSLTNLNARPGAEMVNVVLLQNITVLAIGSSFGGGQRATGEGSNRLTLAVTLGEAQLLMFAAEHGDLGAVLRADGSVGVKPRNDLPRITFDTIEDIIGDLARERQQRSSVLQPIAERGTELPHN